MSTTKEVERQISFYKKQLLILCRNMVDVDEQIFSHPEYGDYELLDVVYDWESEDDNIKWTAVFKSTVPNGHHYSLPFEKFIALFDADLRCEI